MIALLFFLYVMSWNRVILRHFQSSKHWQKKQTNLSVRCIYTNKNWLFVPCSIFEFLRRKQWFPSGHSARKNLYLSDKLAGGTIYQIKSYYSCTGQHCHQCQKSWPKQTHQKMDNKHAKLQHCKEKFLLQDSISQRNIQSCWSQWNVPKKI